jgi:hypothetical protein
MPASLQACAPCGADDDAIPGASLNPVLDVGNFYRAEVGKFS